MVQSGNQASVDGAEGGDVDGRGYYVVGRLAQVHMVVGVHRLAGAEHAPEVLYGPVGDDLVGVHIGGRPGAGLENVHDELVVQRPVRDLLGGHDDGVGEVCVQEPQLQVDLGRGQLDLGEGPDEGAGKSQRADGEVQDGPHGLGAVIGVGRHPQVAHGVALYAGVCATIGLCHDRPLMCPVPAHPPFKKLVVPPRPPPMGHAPSEPPGWRQTKRATLCRIFYVHVLLTVMLGNGMAFDKRCC